MSEAQFLLQKIPEGLLIHPWYKLFKEKLELVFFKTIKMPDKQIQLSKEGVLNPPILYKGILVPNLSKYAVATLAYAPGTSDEFKFFAEMNKEVLRLHREGGVPSFEFLFGKKMRSYTEKVMHLLTANIRKS